MFKKSSSITVVKIANNHSIIPRIEDVPLMAINVKILKFWSLLIADNWRQYAAIIPYMMLNILQLLDLYYSMETADDIIRDAYMTMLVCNTYLRGILMISNRQRFKELLEYLRTLYVELRERTDLDVRLMLEDCTEMAQKLTKINLIMGILTSVGFFISPFYAKERELMFGVHIPFVDKYQSPWYELFFVCEVIMTPSGMCTFIPFTSLVVSFMLFAILMCKVLQHKLRSLAEMPNEKAREEIISCIKYQMKMVSFVDAVNDLNSLIFLVEFLLFGFMLCAMLFSMIIVRTVIQKFIIAMYIVMVFTQSFVMYYYGNELYYQSMEVATAAYDLNWFDYDVETQKILQLLILRSQKPCAILIGNVYPMNLRRLQALLKVTYSVYTLLQRLYG